MSEFADPTPGRPDQAVRRAERGRRGRSGDSRRRVLHRCRPLGQRQDDAAAHAGRHGAAVGRPDPFARGGDHRDPGQPPADLHGVPVARPLPAPQRRAEHRILAQDERRRAGRAPGALRAADGPAASAARLLRQERHQVLGRRTSAGRPGAGARLRPGDPVLRRAAFGDRLQAAQGPGKGAQGHSPGDRQDLRLHHPLARGGDGDERPHRHHAGRQAGPGSARPTRSTISRPTASSRSSWARSTCSRSRRPATAS